ncbi:MAG: S-methyl-5-thioribose-1-phosphate isomerase, partial [Candidatus Bathyarchaeia archaeon]
MNRDLLPPTVAWEDGAVVLIDQRRLPKELRRVRLETVEEVADAIKDMTVRGAPAIGVAAALGLALAAYRSRSESREGLLREIWSARERLRSTRPTAFNLFWALERVMAKASSARGGVEEVREAAIS